MANETALAPKSDQPKALSKYNYNKSSVAGLIEANRSEIEKVLPKHLTFDRMVKLLIFSLDANPDLYKCSQISLFGAVKQIVELGLEPGGPRGLAYLIPYRVDNKDLDRTCQLIIGYKGYLHLARQSGMVADVEARVVHQADEFDISFGLQPRLIHRPALVLKDAAKAVTNRYGAYCIATSKDGFKHVEFMRADEILAIKARAPGAAKKDSPWNVSAYTEEEMWRKTVVRRWAKYTELSPEVAAALDAEDRAEDERRRIDVVEGQSVRAPIAVQGVQTVDVPPPEAPPEPERTSLPPASQSTIDGQALSAALDNVPDDVVEPVKVGEKKPEPQKQAQREPGDDAESSAPPPVKQQQAPLPDHAPTPSVNTDAYADWLIRLIEESTVEDRKKLIKKMNGFLSNCPENRRPAVTAAYMKARKTTDGGAQ